MAKEKSLHVVPGFNGGWVVRKYGSRRPTKRFDSKQQAVAWGRALSQRHETEFVIHRPDGTVQERFSFGSNPLPPHDPGHSTSP